MKILSRKQQMECIKRLNAIRIITDDMNYKAYGEEVKNGQEIWNTLQITLLKLQI